MEEGQRGSKLVNNVRSYFFVEFQNFQQTMNVQPRRRLCGSTKLTKTSSTGRSFGDWIFNGGFNWNLLGQNSIRQTR
jgi:hypothetical protein